MIESAKFTFPLNLIDKEWNFEKMYQMKKYLLIISTVLFSHFLYAQINTETISKYFTGELDDKKINEIFTVCFSKSGGNNQMPWLYTYYSNALAAYPESERNKIQKTENLKFDTSFKNTRKLRSGALIFDTLSSIVTAYGINRNNAHEYEFRVLENESKISTEWTSIKLFCQPMLGQTGPGRVDEIEIAYLGEFKTTFGNNLTIDLREKGNLQIVSSVSLFWIKRSPKVRGIFTNNDLPDFLKVFSSERNIYPITQQEIKLTDSLLVLKRSFNSNENTLLFYLADKVRSKEIIEYKLEGSGQVQDWRSNEYDFNLIWLHDLPPGKYKLLIRYSIQRQNATEYEFEIKPAWHQTTLFKIISGSLIAAFFGFIILLFKTRSQNRNLKIEQYEREVAKSELKAIRTQLNPHFIFNSLSSIQGLVNNENLDGANRYLAEFSQLMRNVLKANDKEFNPLSSELSTIESYLKLEQLRFGFRYSIAVDDQINVTETEVPALLLQPLIENAVKHAVGPQHEKGHLKIIIKKIDRDLHMTIQDNGQGFANSATSEGYGLKLTKSRIELLNKVLKQQSILMDLQTDPTNGTNLTLIYKNWL